MQNLHTVTINRQAKPQDLEEIKSFNDKVGDNSFAPGMNCVALGFLGMEDSIVIVSPATGRTAVFTYDENLFLLDYL